MLFPLEISLYCVHFVPPADWIWFSAVYSLPVRACWSRKCLSDHLLSRSNNFGFEMEIDTAGCRAYDRNYIVGGKIEDTVRIQGLHARHFATRGIASIFQGIGAQVGRCKNNGILSPCSFPIKTIRRQAVSAPSCQH